MIGFYDYTVVLTFLSVLTSIFGMTQAMDGHFRIAIVCLALSGLLDTFDGKVARTKKDRNDDQKLYGIQLDSLADVVCFGVFPIMICTLMGVRGILGGIAVGFYSLCGVIRLAFFNVLETNRQSPAGQRRKGLPRPAHHLHCGDSAPDISPGLLHERFHVSLGAHGHAGDHRLPVHPGF